MTSKLPLYISGIIAFLVTLLSLPLFMKLARAIGLVDHPIHRKTHLKPIPYLGGPALFLGIFASIILAGGWVPSKALPVLLAGGAAAILGLIDDKFQVRARYKLVWQILIAFTLAVLGPRLQFLRIPGIDPIPLLGFSVPLTVFWVLTLVNGLNLIDGVDGLAGATAIAIFAALISISQKLNDPTTLLLSTAAIGATSAFILLNWKPAKIYLGDSGSTGLGFLLSALLLGVGQPDAAHALPLTAEPFQFQIPSLTLIAIYPMLEVTLTVIRRLLRGKSIGSADRGHIHHKLLNNGRSSQEICFTAIVFTFLGYATVMSNLTFTRGVAAWLLLLTGLAVGALLHFCGYLQNLHPQRIRDTRALFLIVSHYIALQEAKLSLAKSSTDIIPIIDQTCIELGVASYHLILEVDKASKENTAIHWSRAPTQLSTTLGIKLNTLGGVVNTDRYTFPDSQTSATWSFMSRMLSDDLDLEHRVLFAQFMRRALYRVESLR